MIDRDAFLLAIGAEPGDTPRLVFADWLEENGDPGRAEFIRAQCELASSAPSADRRPALRVRERELLEEYRRGWCEEIGLPVEDVSFDRGLIARVRLSAWDGGRMLDPTHLTRLATVTELDLSGSGLGDEGLAEFARRAKLPSLRKLILSDNRILDPGVLALAKAEGLPRLETLYLFGNGFGPRATTALRRSSHFRLSNLDTGEREDGYCMSPGEADVARRQFVRQQLLPLVTRYFTEHERLRSAALCVAQYWADEADDAVHGQLVVSELFEPTLEGVTWSREKKDGPDPNIPNTRIASEYGDEPSSVVSLWSDDVQWDDNTDAIPLWAAFAPEEGSQEYEYLSEVYAPAVLFSRHGGYEILPMGRPHLDGVRPEWGWED